MPSEAVTALAGAVPALARVDQLCLLVDDIERTIAEYSELLPVTRWRGYRYGPDTVPELGYRGEPGAFSMWVVLSDSEPQIELIQSITGPSIYTEWLEAHGPGFHHTGFFTQDMAADVQRLEARGFVVSQWGRGYGQDGDGGFTYFDSSDRLGMIVELIEVPAARRPPDREWVVAR